VVRAYEEYAKGTHTLVSLGAFLADLNVVSRNGTPLAKASIKRLLTHRVYLGMVKHGDEWFDGSFEPILSYALFEAVQKVIASKERPRNRRVKHDFPLTGLFRCAKCGGMISAQWATGKSGGRYRYYRCSKKRGRCTQPYVQESMLAEKLRTRLQTISLTDRYTDWMLAQVKEWERENKSASESEIRQLGAEKGASEARMQKLVSLYLDGDIPKETYLKKKDDLMRASLALKEKLRAAESGGKYPVEPLREWIFDLKQADFLSSSDDLSRIKQFVLKVGTNPVLNDKSPRFSVAAPFRFAAKRRASLAAAHSAAPAARPLSDTEVSICGEILTFARTHFARAERVETLT
jgi:ribosomal protein L32